MTLSDRRLVAITGMAVRVPGAADPETLWQNLLAGRVAGKDLPETREPAGRRRIPRTVDLDGVEYFDSEFFGVNPGEATLTDPQHRVLLECAWEALEDAALHPSRVGRKVGVFTSCSMSSYLLRNLLTWRNEAEDVDHSLLIGNDKDFAPTRISYLLDLRGPSLAVQSACSSSLVAVHVAARALLTGDCDAAIVGGVSIVLPQNCGGRWKEGGILSPDGHCRPFDKAAAGTVPGDGCVVIVLRRLADAAADHDRVYGVIAGSAVNNDGAARVGFTAPSPQGQAIVIRAALDEAAASAGIRATDVGMVEAHGTGTALGDPIEIAALRRIYGDPATTRNEAALPCQVHSVKGNIGHLDAAAGLLGLVTATLSLHHGVVPPQAGFTALNPAIRFADGRFAVPADSVAVPGGFGAVAVSSFGLGGTNAHCVLVPPSPAEASAPAADPGAGSAAEPGAGAAADPAAREATAGYLLAISDRDSERLADQVLQLAGFLETADDRQLPRISRTLLRGRALLERRLALRVSTVADAARGLRQWAADQTVPSELCPDPDDAAVAVWASGRALTEDLPGLAAVPPVSLPRRIWRRTRHWQDPPDPSGTSRAGRSGVEREHPGDNHPVKLDDLLEIVRRRLGASALGPDDDFYEWGVESLVVVDMAAEISDRIGSPVSVLAMQDLRTVRAITEHLNGSEAGKAPELVLLRKGEGRPVFLLPPAGGTVYGYQRLAKMLVDPSPLLAVPFPYERRESLRTLRELAKYVADLIVRQNLTEPVRLAGYSFGGNLAFETACQLRRRGHPVDRIVMLDAHPPQAYVGPRPSPDEIDAALPLILNRVLGDGNAAEFLESDQSQRLAGELQVFSQIWRCNHAALKGYWPEEPLDTDLLIFEASDPEDRRLLELLRIQVFPARGWAEHITGKIDIYPVPGDHFGIFTDPSHMASLARAWDRHVAGQEVERELV